MASDDLIFVGVGVLGLAIFVLIFNYVMTTTITEIEATPGINESSVVRGVLDKTQDTIDKYDWVIFAMFMIFVISILITSWFIGGNPLFMIIYVIMGIVSVGLSFILSNTWETISTNSIFASTLLKMPITTYLLTNLPTFMTILFFLAMITLFGKPYIGGDNPNV